MKKTKEKLVCNCYGRIDIIVTYPVRWEIIMMEEGGRCGLYTIMYDEHKTRR